jgi:hypothetical protein
MSEGEAKARARIIAALFRRAESRRDGVPAGAY